MSEVKLSKKQKNVIFYMRKEGTVNVDDLHSKVLESLLSKKLIKRLEDSVFNYELTELGKKIVL